MYYVCSYTTHEAVLYKRTAVWSLGHPISITIHIRRSRHTGLYRRSWIELITDILTLAPIHGHISVGLPAKTYIH